MEKQDANIKTVNIDDIKMLINQEEDSQYKIMNIDVNVPNKNKYRLEFSYSEKFKDLIEDFKDELLDISEELYCRFKRDIYETIKLPENLIYTIAEISIASNVLGNYIVIDMPILRLLSGNVRKKDAVYLRYISEKMESITTELTNNLHSFIDSYLVDLTNVSSIDTFEFMMYYDGYELLYSDFVQTTNMAYEIEKYNIFKLACQERLLEKIEEESLKKYENLHKGRYYKVSFEYKESKVINLNCVPLLYPLAHSS